MDRQLWNVIAKHLTQLCRKQRNQRYTHANARILRVYLWAVMHDRPVSWACDKSHWAGVKPPQQLPDQSTMSRRLRRPETQQLLNELLDRLELPDSHALTLRIDGKPLPIAKHSRAKGATTGRGAGGFQKGYKLHAIYAGGARPVVYHVAPMNVDERKVAAQMISQTPIGEGYLLADANYETNPLYDQVAKAGRMLVTPRRFPNAIGLGQTHKHSEHRVAMIERMKAPSPFIREVLATRRQVETKFANLTSFGGGLTHLPPWVRGDRVAMYVTGKIAIRLARNQVLREHARA